MMVANPFLALVIVLVLDAFVNGATDAAAIAEAVELVQLKLTMQLS